MVRWGLVERKCEDHGTGLDVEDSDRGMAAGIEDGKSICTSRDQGMA